MAARVTEDTSDDTHLAGHALSDTVLALMSYNIGIQNKEVHSGKNWTQKYKRIRDDVEAAFTNEAGIQVLLISEFGNMFDDIDGVLSSGVAQPTGNKVRSTCELFEDLLKSIKLSHIRVVADPPYVALIDSECWQVEHHEVLENICTKHDIKVQHLILKHVNTLETFRCFNAHMPSTYATPKRKEDCVEKMCQVATDSAVGQRTACMPWIIAGDLNVDIGTMSRWCQDFIEKDVPCFSKSEWPQEKNAQKADFALSQGIALVACKSWLGVHSPPCVSDAHDAVVVTGAFHASGVLQPTDTGERLQVDSPDVIEDEPDWGVAPDISGVLQPAVPGHELQVEIQDAIENISKTAMADNGTLEQGDSPEASRHELPRRRYAAQQLLQMVYTSHDGYAVRSNSELLQIMALPIKVRKDMVQLLVKDYEGVYTMQQVEDWYNSEPLSDREFEWAYNHWKEEFPMRTTTRQNIDALKEENTRASKKKARILLNGAFKAYLHKECMNVQLAIALLRHPTAMVNTLLESWAEYLDSDEYLKEKARAQKLDDTNEEAVNEKHRHLHLKMRVHHLRHRVRQAKALDRNPKAITDKNRKLYEDWFSGKLSGELDECTPAHGYGKLQSTGEMLENSGFRGPRRQWR